VDLLRSATHRLEPGVPNNFFATPLASPGLLHCWAARRVTPCSWWLAQQAENCGFA